MPEVQLRCDLQYASSRAKTARSCLKDAQALVKKGDTSMKMLLNKAQQALDDGLPRLSSGLERAGRLAKERVAHAKDKKQVKHTRGRKFVSAARVAAGQANAKGVGQWTRSVNKARAWFKARSQKVPMCPTTGTPLWKKAREFMEADFPSEAPVVSKVGDGKRKRRPSAGD